MGTVKGRYRDFVIVCIGGTMCATDLTTGFSTIGTRKEVSQYVDNYYKFM